jgi:prepilin-type N-terminal cleavage/methylation domain-containing protein
MLQPTMFRERANENGKKLSHNGPWMRKWTSSSIWTTSTRSGFAEEEQRRTLWGSQRGMSLRHEPFDGLVLRYPRSPQSLLDRRPPPAHLPRDPDLMQRSHRQGFTLIELSIVIDIIALIIGGVLVGKDMIAAATVRAQVGQIEKYQTAVNTFIRPTPTYSISDSRLLPVREGAQCLAICPLWLAKCTKTPSVLCKYGEKTTD